MISVNEENFRQVILAFLWLKYIWELYLSIRQYRKMVASNEVPPEFNKGMSKETFDNAKEYTIAQLKYSSFKKLFLVLLSTIVIYFDIFAVIWDFCLSINPFGTSDICMNCLWIFVLITLKTITDLPWQIYYIFVLEEKFGFNNQTCGLFVCDRIKVFILIQIAILPISCIAIITIKNGGEFFFMWLWLVQCIFYLIVLTIYPFVIAPIFDKYTLLPEGELRTEIEKLASEVNFPLNQLYMVQGSKRSSHSNAYIYGFFKKRIVLYDSLLPKDDGKGCEISEILGVLSHELGHWKHNHLLKLATLEQIDWLLLFIGFSFIFQRPFLYRGSGFCSEQPVLVGLIIVQKYVMLPYSTLMSFITKYWQQKFELEADQFSSKIGKAKALIDALIQLTKDNLIFPICDRSYCAWYHMHPSTLERLKILRQCDCCCTQN